MANNDFGMTGDTLRGAERFLQILERAEVISRNIARNLATVGAMSGMSMGGNANAMPVAAPGAFASVASGGTGTISLGLMNQAVNGGGIVSPILGANGMPAVNMAAVNQSLNGAAQMRASAMGVQSQWNTFQASPAMQSILGGSPYSGPSFAQMMAAIGARQQAALEARVGMFSGAAYVGADFARAYTQSVVSGQPNPMGFGQAFGGAMGLGAAGIALAAGAGMGVAGPLGLGIGLLAGAGINAAQAPYIARMGTAQTLGGYAAVTNQNAMTMALRADTIANSVNDSFLTPHWSNENALRRSGTYTGIDQTSPQDVAKVMSSLGSGFMGRGMFLGPEALDGMATRFATKYGLNAPGVAEAYGKAQSGMASTGGNWLDLARKVGVSNVATLMQVDGIGGVEDLVRNYGRYEASERRVRMSGFSAQIAASDYAVSGYSGKSTRERGGEYSAFIGSLQSQVSALDASIAAADRVQPGSEEAKAKRALKSQILADIAKEASQRASGVLSDASSDASVRYSNVNIGVTKATLYGDSAEIGRVGNVMSGALDAEAADIRRALTDPNLSYGERQRARSRLYDIQNEKTALPAKVASQQFGRDMGYASMGVSSANRAMTVAGLYGDDAELGAAAQSGMGAQQGIFDAARRTYLNPNASVEDRISAFNAMEGAAANSAQIRASSRDTLLGRISGRAGVAQSAAGNAYSRALTLGKGDVVRHAGIGMVNALGSERSDLQAQLDAGGLTVDQEIRLRGRINSLDGQIFQTEQNNIDAAYGKDDTVFATGYGNLQTAKRLASSLPFSPGGMIALSGMQMKAAGGQISALNAREKALSLEGNLSPERAFAISQQRNALIGDIADEADSLSRGMIDKLPSLNAGRPLRFRGNSFSLAAMRFSDTPVRLFGASSGSEMIGKDNIISQLLGGGSSPLMGNTGVALGQTNSILEAILHAILTGGLRSTSQEQDANRSRDRMPGSPRWAN